MPGRLTKLVDKLKAAHGSSLVSVILYGSAASGDHHDKHSDFNILCVLSEIGTPQLRASEDVFEWWRGEGNPAPLLLTEHEVLTSTDCFAIEFRDIRDSHRLLYGKDVVSGLVIDDSFYRAQVERELRSKLLRLRTKAAGTLSDIGPLARMMEDSISTFCMLFRHALILTGNEAPTVKREIVAAAARAFGIDASPFETLLTRRESGAKMKAPELEALLTSYIKEIEHVIDTVDALEK